MKSEKQCCVFTNIATQIHQIMSLLQNYSTASLITFFIIVDERQCNLQMPKSDNCRCFAFCETWRHLGIAQTSLALLSVCTSFPCEDLLSGIFFLLFSISLFPVCFFCQFLKQNHTGYQLLIKDQQDFKKRIMAFLILFSETTRICTKRGG